MNKLPFRENILFDRQLFFTFFLICVEFYQYFNIKNSQTIGGDFGLANYDGDMLGYSLAISVAGWLIVGNLFLTVFGEVGSAVTNVKGAFSILTTIIPISYLLLALGTGRIGWRFNFAALFFILIDLYRVLLGALFFCFYIFISKASRKLIFTAILMLPIIYLTAGELIKYKSEARGFEVDNVQAIVLDTVSKRISSTPTLLYGLSNLEDLSLYCHSENYASQYEAAILSIIPKIIFGIQWVKTYNNCLIEYRWSASIDDSSVNSPWLLNLLLLWNYSIVELFSYAFLTLTLIIYILKMSNYLFGLNSEIVKYWLVFQFIWTGNILHLTIPAYFLSMLFIYHKFFRKITI